MNATRTPRSRILKGVDEGARRQYRDALSYVRLTMPQRVFLSDGARFKLWRDGNQIGKSHAIALEVVWTASNRHPFLNMRRGPKKVLVISLSKEQMVPLHEKIWNLLPKDEIDPRNGFDPGRGITGKPPRIIFIKGPGRGSEIHFASYEQGAQRIAGGTYDLVVLDEPPPESVYGEAVPRVFRRRGRIVIGMTPTPKMPDVRWLRKKTEEGEIVPHNFGLSQDNVWLDGAAMPFLTQQEIDAFERSLLRVEREMRMRGAWEATVDGAVLDHFLKEDHVHAFSVQRVADKYPNHIVAVGYDHGLKPNKEAITIAIFTGGKVDLTERRVLDDPEVWIVDSEEIDGHATPEIIVERTIFLLQRNGLTWRNVDVWVGDRDAQSKHRHTRLNNRYIERAWADALKIPYAERPVTVHTAFKPAGSVYEGLRLINTLCHLRSESGRTKLHVHPQNVRLIEAFQKHKGADSDPLKDILDSFRYPAMRVVRAGEWMTKSFLIQVA